MQEGHAILLEIFGLKITLWMLITGLVGGIPAIAGLYKMYVLWDTREERRYKMLRRYLENEERNISSKRSEILKSIRNASRSYLTEREFDVGHELDEAIVYLDSGHPEMAEARLKEIEKRLERNESLLKSRAEDLAKHRASVQVFLATLAGELKNSDQGLEYVQEALSFNPNDLDALRCQSQLLFSKGELNRARQGYDRLRRNSNGTENASYRAEAYLGLAMIEMATGIEGYDEADRNLTNATNNLKNGSDPYTRASAHRLRGDLLADENWHGCNLATARQEYREAARLLKEIRLKRVGLELEIEALEAKIKCLDEGKPETAKNVLLLS
ncbi:MAG: hypothetical protein CTY28_11615 [Hyphomicrobium sp.]|nr:MAG: hypothetical protein CTY28_11615 [Hyphomicrobium sp.]